MIYGSLCSGIEAASMAWEPLGWRPAWFSEVEPFPSAVLAHHWPTVDNLGDMTLIPELLRSKAIEAPDVLVGGTPCQAFSVAGMRKGLEDERGQLTIKYVEVANEIDNQRPEGAECIAVWENVPGVLSDKSNAFGCFLGALVGESCALEPPGERWTNAGIVYGPQRIAGWRILDAQYFGVAQRRRRVFVIASARKGFDPGKVLFESEGLRRDSPPSREEGEGIAPTVTSGPPFSRTGNQRVEAEALVYPDERAFSTSGAGYWRDGVGALRGREQDSHENIVSTLDASYGKLQGCSGQDLNHGHSHLVVHGTQDPLVSDKAFPLGCNGGQENVIAIQGSMIGRKDEAGPMASGINENICFTLNATDRHAVAVTENQRAADQHAPAIILPIHDKATRQEGGGARQEDGVEHNDGAGNGLGIGKESDPMYTVTGGDRHAVAFQASQSGVRLSEVAGTLDANYGSRRHNGALEGMTVRRFLPVECEKLQGFSPNHTRIPWRGKLPEDCPDGPRYKAIGNSMAVPCMEWLGERIEKEINGY